MPSEDAAGAAPPAPPPAPPMGRRQGWRLPISAVLAFGFGGLVALAVGAVLGLLLDVAQRTTNDLLRFTAEDEIGRLVDGLANHLDPARDVVEFVAAQIESGEVPIESDERLQDLLLGTLAATPQVSGVALVRDDLSVVRAGREGGSYAAATDNWIDRADIRLGLREAPTLDGFIWGGPVYMEVRQNTFLAPRRPLRIDGQFRGFMTAIVSVTELSDFLTTSTGGLGGVSFILHGHDRVFAHPALARPDPSQPVPELNPDHPLPLVSEIGDPILQAMWQPGGEDLREILGDSPVKGRLIDMGDAEHVVIYREITDYGEPSWVVGVHLPADAVGAPLRRLILAAAVGFGILVLAVIAALLLGRTIAQPVRRLAAVADALRALDPARIGALPRSPLRELDSAALAFNSMITGLRWFATYVPRSLVLMLMRRGDGELVSDERALTVLFTDMIGFSAIAQRLTPPQLADFLNRHFGLLAACIEAEGGTVDKYIGDSVMAFWNAPETQPDHAARACRAARRIAEALAADNARRLAKGQRPVRVRIGIHTGPAIAGNIGAPGRVNYTLIGDTVNTAQRLEQFGKEIDDGRADAVVLLSGVTAAEVGCEGLRGLGRRVLPGRSDEIEVYALR